MHKNPQMTVFAILVAALAFYAARPFWGTLSAGQVSSPDWFAPIAYFFAALFGVIHLVRLGRETARPRSERTLYLIAALVLVAAPFLLYAISRTMIAGILLRVLDWAAGPVLILALLMAARRKGFTKIQLSALVLSIVAALIPPLVLWWPGLFEAGLLPGRLFFWLFRYGVWIVAVVWCVTAWLMLPRPPARRLSSQAEVLAANADKLRRWLTTGTVIGLGIFMGGMYNPVQYSSDVYEQRTYFLGRLTSTSLVDVPDMNGALLLGMGLIVFSLLLLLLPLPGTRPLPRWGQR